MVLEMLMESLFAVVDVFLGVAARARRRRGDRPDRIRDDAWIYAVAIGISFAATANSSARRSSARRIAERAAAASAQIIMLGVTVSAGLGVRRLVLRPTSSADRAPSPGIVAMADRFARIMLGGNVHVFMIS
jgi:hypothetical protein